MCVFCWGVCLHLCTCVGVGLNMQACVYDIRILTLKCDLFCAMIPTMKLK